MKSYDGGSINQGQRTFFGRGPNEIYDHHSKIVCFLCDKDDMIIVNGVFNLYIVPHNTLYFVCDNPWMEEEEKDISDSGLIDTTDMLVFPDHIDRKLWAINEGVYEQIKVQIISQYEN